MTEPPPAEGTVTIASQSIELLLTGKPDVPYKWGIGSIRPAIVIFTYLPDGIRAHLYGVWVREDGELTDDPCDQAYRIGDTDEWPAWLAELAREHKPADRAPAVNRAAVLREAAGVADRIAVAMGAADEDWASRARWACASVAAEFRRMASLDEQPPTGDLAQRIAAKRGEDAFVGAAALMSSAGPLLACPDPIECGHEAALGQAQQEIRRLGLMVDEYGHGASTLSEKLQEARATNRRLNLRAQKLESEVAAYRRAVGQWELSKRGTYVPLRTIAAIAKAAGRDIETPQWLLHYQRVEQAEAAIERVRRLHDSLEQETDLSGPDDLITKGSAARRIATALDGWSPALLPSCDVEFVGGGRCAKPAGHRPPGSDDPHVPVVVPARAGEEPDGGTREAEASWPRRAWDLGLLHKGGDPHHCPACVAQPEPPKDFICPGAEANAVVLANPQPKEA